MKVPEGEAEGEGAGSEGPGPETLSQAGNPAIPQAGQKIKEEEEEGIQATHSSSNARSRFF